jgi:hypothetical protein
VTREIVVNLPSLHPGRSGSGGQVAVDDCDARFIICFCGRRWGKTTLGVRKCIKGALAQPDRIFWWVGPSYPTILASRAWPMLKELTLQIPGTKVYESDHYVRLTNGSEIWIKSADREDSLRGPKLSGLVVDEMAQIRETTWTQELRPALTDEKGWALFIGTPKGKNWTYHLYNKAANRKGWARFKRTTYDNPFIDPAEIEDAKIDLTEEEFAQEYMADFGASQYLVWPTFDRDIHRWKGDIPEFTRYYGGLDFGGDTISSHLSTGVVAGLTKNDELVMIAEFAQAGPNIGERQLEWMSEVQEITKQIDARNGLSSPHVIQWNADKSQMWGIQLVRNMGFTISKTKGGKDSVIQGIDTVARRLKVRADGKPRLYYMRHLHFVVDAFEVYRFPEPRGRDLPQSTNPLKVNDDMPDAIRYMVEGKDRGVIGDPMDLYKNVLPVVRTDPRKLTPRYKLRKKLANAR